jgi:hypothetical protein
MPGERNREAEHHADRAHRILGEHDETVRCYFENQRSDQADVTVDWEEKLEAVRRSADRAAALATAHALTALALRKVDGR